MADKRFSVFAVALIVVLIGFTNVRGEDFGKVLPLGDSITWGASTAGGYRDPLYQLLTADGHTLSYVGTASDNSSPLLTADKQRFHQGMSGWVIATGAGRDGLYESITDWMAIADPDMILLMIGTNDCGLDFDIPNIQVRLNALVERIFTNKPSVKLLLATVIPSSDAGTEANVVVLNAQIPTIVANHQALGRNIQLVPMYDALNASTDLKDTLHPDRGGYHKMAMAWYESITADVPTEINPPDVVLSSESASGSGGSGAEGVYAVNIVTDDLISDSSPMLTSWSRGAVYFELNTLNDGGYDGSGGYGGTYVSETFDEGYLPCTYTYELDTSLAPYGYDITEIRTYAGYASSGPCLANQKYALLLDYVDDDPDFVWVGNFEYSPFSNSDSDPVAATQMTLTSNADAVASGVSRVRFILLDHGHARGQYDGSVYQEIDVLGERSTPEPTLAAYWPFNDNGGSVVADISGNGYDGDIANMDLTSWASGKQCGGLSFDGTDDYVNITGFKGITGTASRTCAAWIKTSSVSGEILTWGNTETGRKWIIRVNETGSLRAEVQGGYIYGTTLVADGNWHHIAVVLGNDGTPDISEALLYVDGQLETIADVADEPIDTASDQDVVIGVFTKVSDRYFNGLIDEVRIYNYALSDLEVQAVYRQYLLVADKEPDGDVDLDDLSILAKFWQVSDSCEADLTCDCVVDLSDLKVLIDEWLDSI